MDYLNVRVNIKLQLSNTNITEEHCTYRGVDNIMGYLSVTFIVMRAKCFTMVMQSLYNQWVANVV